MDKPIRVPRNQTALMQLLQRQVSSGHYYWCADTIPKHKLTGFIDKWSGYALRSDAPARAYRKQTKRASVHLCLNPAGFGQLKNADIDGQINSKEVEVTRFPTESPVGWWLLSTAGKAGLIDGLPTPSKVFDCRTDAGRLRFKDYELVLQTKVVKSGGKSKQLITWTWRLTSQRYKAWEALLIERAKVRDLAGVVKAIDCLRAMPMFAGIRMQVIKLIAEANRMLIKMKLEPIEVPTLPVMRMIELWADEIAF
jgi:hypothetical protein